MDESKKSIQIYEEFMNMSEIKNSFEDLRLEISELKDLGIMNSLIYAEKFMNFCSNNLISKENKIRIIMLSGMVNNRDRVIQALMRGKNKNEMFMKLINDIQKFGQYVSTSFNTYPFVKINTSFPSLALLGSILQSFSFMKEDETNIMISLPHFARKTHFAQLDLDTITQEMHKKWERDFWDSQVKKTRNTNISSFEPGFHMEYYLKKEEDKFKLIEIPKIRMPISPYNLKDIFIYAKEVLTFFGVTEEIKIVEAEHKEALEKEILFINKMLMDSENLKIEDFTNLYSKFLKKKENPKSLLNRMQELKQRIEKGEIVKPSLLL